MRLTLATPPDPAFFDDWIGDAKVYVGVDGSAHDALIVQLIQTAAGRLDGPAGSLGRAIAAQTWRYRFDESEGEVVIPLPPVRSVVSIGYVPPGGTAETMPSGDYVVDGNDPAFLRPRTRWPATDAADPGLVVTFAAGYATLADVPAPIKTGIFEYVAALYDNRGGLQTIPPIASDLLDAYRARAF